MIGADGVKRPVLLVECPIEGGSRGILESIAQPLGMNISLSPVSTNGTDLRL